MSESLKTTLHEQATSVVFRPPDLGAIRHAADRRIRLRRAAASLAGALAVALIGVSVVVLGRPGDPSPVVSPWPVNTVTWATGSTIHVGAEAVQVGHTVRAYVRTVAGFATIDDADNVYSVTAEGVQQIGHATAAPPFDSDAGEDQARLVAGTHGTFVGWIGEDKFGWAVLQTYDQATGRLRSYPKPGVAPWRDAVFYAIDGHTGYWGTLAGVYEVDLDSGDERPLTTDEEFRSFELYSVQNGVLAFRRDDSFFAGASVDRAKEMIRRGDDVLTLVTPPYRLSPTGAWLSLGVTQLEKLAEDNYRGVKHAAEVYNTSTGAHITLDVMLDAPQNTALAIPVLWLDDVTVQVVAVSSDVPFDSQPASVHATLYACTVPEGSCRLAADLGTVGANGSNAPVLPDGRGVSR
jgi:hypothetical protein